MPYLDIAYETIKIIKMTELPITACHHCIISIKTMNTRQPFYNKAGMADLLTFMSA